MSAREQRAGGIRILCPCCTKKLKQNLKFDSTIRFQRLAAVCDELGFTEEAAVYKKLLTDAGQPTVEVPDVNNLLGRDTEFPERAAKAASGASAQGARGQRATSNVNTAARTDRLVGGANARPAAANQRLGRQGAAANPVFRNAANNSLSPKSNKSTVKSASPKPKAAATAPA